MSAEPNGVTGTDWTFSSGSVHDLSDVMTVMADAFQPAFGEAWTAAQVSGIMCMPGTALLVARVDETPAGFALTRTIVDESELLLLAVRPMFARCGIGRGLLLTALDNVQSIGVKYMHLEVRADNPAVRLYDAVGFAKVGVRPGYYRGHDGIIRDAFTYQRILTEFN